MNFNIPVLQNYYDPLYLDHGAFMQFISPRNSSSIVRSASHGPFHFGFTAQCPVHTSWPQYPYLDMSHETEHRNKNSIFQFIPSFPFAPIASVSGEVALSPRKKIPSFIRTIVDCTFPASTPQFQEPRCSSTSQALFPSSNTKITISITCLFATSGSEFLPPTLLLTFLQETPGAQD
ncbi:uncharacterized protein LY79DRAFT_582208 [Colletotrichum navitas]|uniref:Uncharacterized protein n=1 Tax=Colletotrichum navitas TaxID=681940 RepID=A0AAD8V1P5_9PEZI|nr:uncharacterized protein LY79DRAFT_582208 [Colletotrichum navitas]KAK1579982.1 hypothetical protein LY79DRAFT_582208 [Colletotrichum navitas]